MIYDPASPNPKANKVPIFTINFYKITVSNFSSSWSSKSFISPFSIN